LEVNTLAEANATARRNGDAPRGDARRAPGRLGCGWARYAAASACIFALLCANAPSAEAASFGLPVEPKIGVPAPEETPPSELLLTPGGLLDAFHREREHWKDFGITFSLHERSEVWADAIGGGHQGVSYDGLTIAKLDVDLDKMVGWPGAEFFASAFDVHDHGPTRSLVGNLQVVSNIEATPSIKLYDLWLDQSIFDKKLSIRLGQEGANDEMMTTAYGGLFLNSSFGFPGMPAAVLPSGGPNYPMATPFARVQLNASDKLTVLGAVYNGDPAPPGTGDPQIRDRNGTAFRLNGHALAFGEVWYSPDPSASASLPTTYKLGMWYASNQFADQRLDNTGGLLANPASSGTPLNRIGDWAFYGIIDQKVWQRSGSNDQGVGLFLQVMGGPSDRNLSNLFIEAGMNWLAPLTQRPNDTFGLAVAYLGISPAARDFSRELVSFGRATSAYASNETVFEATYQAPVTSWLTLQPDLQFVLNPGAGVPGPFGNRSLANAVVIGMRATFKL
jgi:porin